LLIRGGEECYRRARKEYEDYYCKLVRIKVREINYLPYKVFVRVAQIDKLIIC